MNTHPIEHLPAYALGALSDEDARRVAAHLLVCPPCREEVEAFRASVGLMPGTPPPPMPPHHIKQQLMARIHAAKAARRPAVIRYATGGVWSNVAAVCSLLLALIFGTMMVDARRQLAATQIELQAVQEQNLANQRAIAAFLSNPATVSQPMQDVQTGAHGNMYMQAGHTRAVLVLGDLPPLQPGTTYQFWFADAAGQVPSGTFSIDTSGQAQVVFDAPNAVNSYAEVMVTVEPAGGSTTPSTRVVLAAKLVA